MTGDKVVVAAGMVYCIRSRAKWDSALPAPYIPCGVPALAPTPNRNRNTPDAVIDSILIETVKSSSAVPSRAQVGMAIEDGMVATVVNEPVPKSPVLTDCSCQKTSPEPGAFQIGP